MRKILGRDIDGRATRFADADITTEPSATMRVGFFGHRRSFRRGRCAW